MSKEYIYVKTVNPSVLDESLNATELKPLIELVAVTGNVIKITTSRDLSRTELATLQSVIVKHNPAEAIAKQKMMDAIAFGQSIVLEVSVENVMLKFDTNQVLGMLVKFANIKAMLESGSLYTALMSMQAIKPDPVLMPQARIDKYVNKVKNYLGI